MTGKSFQIIVLCTALASGVFMTVPEQANAQEATLVETINTSSFAGRYTYEASMSASCSFLIKEINARCPDQRGEISFDLGDVRAKADEPTGGLIIESTDGTAVILQRLFYRGASTRDRRFCKAPEGAALKSQDQMHAQKHILYSQDMDHLSKIASQFNALSQTCQSAPAG